MLPWTSHFDRRSCPQLPNRHGTNCDHIEEDDKTSDVLKPCYATAKNPRATGFRNSHQSPHDFNALRSKKHVAGLNLTIQSYEQTSPTVWWLVWFWNVIVCVSSRYTVVQVTPASCDQACRARSVRNMSKNTLLVLFSASGLLSLIISHHVMGLDLCPSAGTIWWRFAVIFKKCKI